MHNQRKSALFVGHKPRRVVGMLVYRLKNIWQHGGWRGHDPCNNPSPHPNGLGLVERCGVNGTGALATPQSVAFYHKLLRAVSGPGVSPASHATPAH